MKWTCLLLLLMPALAADGDSLLVVHKNSASLGCFNLETRLLEWEVKTGGKPHEFALSDDEKYAFVTDYGADTWTEPPPGGNRIAVIELATRKVSDEIPLGEYRRPHGIERGRSGVFYVTTDFPSAVLVIDARGRVILHAIRIAGRLPHMIQVASDEKTAWTANAASGDVSVIDLKAKKEIKQIAVGGVPMGFAMTRDEKRLFVATRTNNMVTEIDAVKGVIARTSQVPGHPVRLLLSGDERYLAASLIDSGEAALLDTADLREVRRTAVGKRAEGMTAAPGGEAFYVSAQGEDTVVKLALPSLEKLQSIKTLAKPDPLHVLRKPSK